MNVRHVSMVCMVAALMANGMCFGLDKAFAAQEGQTEDEEGVQVLTRGPVHEAFAETITFNPEAGIVVTRPAPDPIEEVPPDQRPEGANVAWIPGYWAWDDERDDFLWVSGIWRSLPPGREWVPGYWGQSGQGFQWTSGYWADAKASEVEYLPEPPATAEVGPNIAAPSPDDNWAPGCWIWQQNRYAWRPGYWASGQPDWDWVPAHYVWTPRGYVFVDGYWDHSVSRRGVLFAPVYFNASVYGRRGFSYSPVTVIDLAAFTNHLFLRPHYRHYYFGDYYAASYSNAGFYPWYAFNASGYGYDPIYAQQRWHNRQNREWERRVEADFRNRRDHEDARPLRTLAAQQEFIKNGVKSKNRGLVVAKPLDQLAKSKDSPLRFQPLNKEERQKLVQRGKEVRKFREERLRLETQAAATSAERPSKELKTARVKLPRSPIVANPADELNQDGAPPKAHDTPQPDPQVKPKPRVKRPSEQPRPHKANRLPLDDTEQTPPNAPPRGTPTRTGKKKPASAHPPRVDPPRPKTQPKSQVDQKQLEPQPQSKVARPIQPKSRVDRRPAQAPGVNRSAKQPQRQAKVNRPAPQPERQPKANRPAPQPERQAKVNRPAPQPERQPKANRPAPQPERQPKANRPAPQLQRQPKANRLAPQPQRQPKVNRSAPRVNRPAPQPQAKPAAPPRGSAGPAPSAGPKQDKSKDKGDD